MLQIRIHNYVESNSTFWHCPGHFIRYDAGLQFSSGVFNKTAETKISNGTIVIRAPEMLIDGKDDVVIDLRTQENGLKEAGFRCHLYDLAPLLLDKEMHITQVKPVVTKLGSADVVHHMYFIYGNSLYYKGQGYFLKIFPVMARL